MITPYNVVFKFGKFLLDSQSLKSKSGAKFANRWDYRSYLSSKHKGLLLDGQSLRLSERESFQNVCVIARVGAGKTSQYIIPNVLDKANHNCSMVINDPKGEVYEQTSKHLKDKGYNILVLNPEDLQGSDRFNPLWELTNPIEIEQLAHILITSGNKNANDPFWNNGAIRFTSLFLKCLLNAAEENPGYFTLSNLYYLFQNFGDDGQVLDDFMIRYTANPHDPNDASLWNEWRGVLTGNEDGIKSFILNAITALKALANRNIANLTASSTFKLSDLRRRKTVIYFITPAQHAEYYGFLTSIFFQSVFNLAMRKLPARNDLPIYVLYDEFGHSTLPNFVSTANTIRGYKVSLSIVLQSISQLSARYGKDYAASILGGFNTYLTYAGADPETARFFESIIGRVRERSRQNRDDKQEKYQEYNLLNSNEVRTITNHQALIVSSNRDPVLLNVLPHYANKNYVKALSKGAYSVNNSAVIYSLAWVPLRF